MRTPAGNECRFFYGDYYRGRHHEECQLLASAAPPLPWKPELCRTCPVPAILLANACPNLIFRPELKRPFPFLKEKVEVRSYCTQSKLDGFDPYIGCGECHRLPDIFAHADDSDASD